MPWQRPSGRSSGAQFVFISPCLPTVAPKAPLGPGWVHEIKHDGYRLQMIRMRPDPGSKLLALPAHRRRIFCARRFRLGTNMDHRKVESAAGNKLS
jgi:hypothetical protein